MEESVFGSQQLATNQCLDLSHAIAFKIDSLFKKKIILSSLQKTKETKRNKKNGLKPSPYTSVTFFRNLSTIKYSLSIEVFWKRYGYTASPPDYEIVDREQTPKLYHDLLYRNDLITPALEKFYEGKLETEVLAKRIERSSYQRKMKGYIKKSDQNKIPVIISYTNLDLKAFPPKAQLEILAGAKPLGKIVKDHQLNVKVICHYLIRINEWEDLSHEDLGNLPAYGRRATFFIDSKPVVELIDVLI